MREHNKLDEINAPLLGLDPANEALFAPYSLCQVPLRQTGLLAHADQRIDDGLICLCKNALDHEGA